MQRTHLYGTAVGQCDGWSPHWTVHLIKEYHVHRSTHVSRPRRLALTAALAVLVSTGSVLTGSVSAGASPTTAPTTSSAASTSRSAAAYFAAMRPVVEASNPTPGKGSDTAWKAAAIGREEFARRARTARAITPPATFRRVHRDFVAALDGEAKAFEAATRGTPYDAPADQLNAYLFSDTTVGYAFGRETDAGCRLREAAERSGVTDFPSRVLCYEKPKTAASVGTVQKPVNAVTLVNDPLPDSAGAPCPRVDYQVTTITASSRKPVTIAFDNRNPYPCLFNLAVYRGTPKVLTSKDQIAATAASGPKRHELTLTLEPGVYTYADNVHPYVMRGTLRVLP